MNAPIVLAAVAAIGITVVGVGSAYVVNEGNVGVITNMSRAVRQEGPEGLKFKMPFVTGVKEFDVRERVLSGDLNAATQNQLPTTISLSINWKPDSARVMEIYQLYGSPDEFANNTIRPRINQTLKATVGKFTGVELIREREVVAAAMLEAAQGSLEGFPLTIASIQIENFSLPPRYMEAVLLKEEQREATDREGLALEQQKIVAQRDVQTAEAARDSAIASADGKAYATRTNAAADSERIKLMALAEAEGVEAVQKAIAASPLFVEYQRVKQWNGVLPVTVMGDQPELLMQMPSGE